MNDLSDTSFCDNSVKNSLFVEMMQPPLIQQFHERTLREIPILQAMGIHFSDYNQGEITVRMPLAPNINDKNTGFGGSIVTLATISGWSLLSLLLNRQEKRFDVIIGESATQYLSPVVEDCYSVAKLSEEEIHSISQDLETKGRTRISIDVNVFVQEKITASFKGQYHVRPVKTSTAP